MELVMTVIWMLVLVSAVVCAATVIVSGVADWRKARQQKRLVQGMAKLVTRADELRDQMEGLAGWIDELQVLIDGDALADEYERIKAEQDEFERLLINWLQDVVKEMDDDE